MIQQFSAPEVSAAANLLAPKFRPPFVEAMNVLNAAIRIAENPDLYRPAGRDLAAVPASAAAPALHAVSKALIGDPELLVLDGDEPKLPKRDIKGWTSAQIDRYNDGVRVIVALLNNYDINRAVTVEAEGRLRTWEGMPRTIKSWFVSALHEPTPPHLRTDPLKIEHLDLSRGFDPATNRLRPMPKTIEPFSDQQIDSATRLFRPETRDDFLAAIGLLQTAVLIGRRRAADKDLAAQGSKGVPYKYSNPAIVAIAQTLAAEPGLVVVADGKPRVPLQGPTNAETNGNRQAGADVIARLLANPQIADTVTRAVQRRDRSRVRPERIVEEVLIPEASRLAVGPGQIAQLDLSAGLKAQPAYAPSLT